MCVPVVHKRCEGVSGHWALSTAAQPPHVAKRKLRVACARSLCTAQRRRKTAHGGAQSQLALLLPSALADHAQATAL